MKEIRDVATYGDERYILCKEGYNFFVTSYNGDYDINIMRKDGQDVDGYMGQNYSQAFQLYAYRSIEKMGEEGYAEWVSKLAFEDKEFEEALQLPLKSSTNQVIESLETLIGE